MSDAPSLKLPDLPQPDQAALDAVRNFLPVKLLQRTTALLYVTVLALGWAGVIDYALKHWFDFTFSSSTWRMLVLFGLPTLATLWHLAQEAADLRRQRRVSLLARTDPQIPKGYFRIGPYENRPEDIDAYRRADGAHVKALNWVQSATAVPLYITGDSGSGKSSLLNAYVLPKLRESGWIVLEARAYQDPESALREALIAELASNRGKRPEAETTTRQLIETVARKAERGLFLALDQFEEFVILAEPAARERFAGLWGEFVAKPNPKVRMVLVLRREYEPQLEEAGLPEVHAGVNRLEVGRFTHSVAAEFLNGAQLGLGPEALEALLASAAALDGTPGLIRPITLNVLGHVIESGKTASISSLDAGDLVRGYIAQVVDHPDFPFSRPVLERLITSQETKQPKTKDELVRLTGLKRGDVGAMLNALAAAGLARPLDQAKTLWELSHDFVARAVSHHLGRRRRQTWRLIGAYASPAMLATAMTAGGVYEMAVASPARELRKPLPYRDEQWVTIDPGGFCMGSRAKDDPVPQGCEGVSIDPEAQADEKPLRRVEIKSKFRLAKYEVTIEEYARFANDRHQTPPGDPQSEAELKNAPPGQLPVVNVSWEDAADYAVWLSEKTGKHFRLPTEAEWEYAARAKSLTARPWGDDPEHNAACGFANVLDRLNLEKINSRYNINWPSFDCDDPYAFSAPVGQFKANSWGLHDMLGNVWEWVDDCYHDTYENAPVDGSRWLDGEVCASGLRVLRGGSWDNQPADLRSADRFGDSPVSRDFTLGFRFAQDLP